MTLLQQSVSGDVDVAAKAAVDSLLQGAVQKAALRFVPLLTIAYLFNYLDRTSLGFALPGLKDGPRASRDPAPGLGGCHLSVGGPGNFRPG